MFVMPQYPYSNRWKWCERLDLDKWYDRHDISGIYASVGFIKFDDNKYFFSIGYLNSHSLNPLIYVENKWEAETILLVLKEYLNSTKKLEKYEILRFFSLIPEITGIGKIYFGFENEQQFEIYFMIQCLFRGWRCDKRSWSRKNISKKGIPDRLVTKSNGEKFWVEIKTPKGILSKYQKLKHKELLNKGEKVYVIRTVKDVEELFEKEQEVL